MSSVLESLQTYIKTYTSLAAGAPVWAEFLGNLPTEYSIVPLPGQKTIATYLDDSTLEGFPFAIESTVSVADDITRIENNSFYEHFARWLKQQNDAGNFPTLATGQQPESIEAVSQGFLIERTPSQTGIYHLICLLTYTQTP